MWRKKKSCSYKTERITTSKEAASFKKHAAGSPLKGRAEAQRPFPLFEPVICVFFIECARQRDNTLSQWLIHLRIQVTSGEFNLESVGLDTLVINQLRARVCDCMRGGLCAPLSACDKSLSNPVQDPQCLSPLHPTEDKFIYKWCADNTWTGKLFHLTCSAAAERAVRHVYVWRFTGERRKSEFQK